MHGYQDTAVDFMKVNPFSLIFIDLGLGKTIICLTLIIWLLLTGSSKKVLVIAPLRVAAQTWPNEIPLWDHTLASLADKFTLIRAEDDDPEVVEAGKAAIQQAREELGFFKVGKWAPEDLKAVASAGQKARTAKKVEIRLRKLAEKTPLHFINREQVEWLVDQHSIFVRKKGRKYLQRVIQATWPYDTVIIDESSSFKDHATNRFQALAEVRVQGFIKRLHELTATPASESYMGLFAQTFLADLGARLGRVITHFRKKYFDYNDYSKVYTLLPGAQESISDAIADITLVMEAKDYLKGERSIELPRHIKLEKHELEAYNRFERTFVYDLPDGQFVEALNAGSLSGQLVQLSSGALYGSDGKTIIIHDHVLDDLEELVEELNGSPLLVSYWYKSSLQRLKKRFPKIAEMDRAGNNVKPWNDNKFKLMAVHPASVAHGLNMQYGEGHDVYHFDAIFSNELFKQINGRLARQGQRQLVRIHEPRVIGTAHDSVYSKTGWKENGEQALKQRIKRIRAEMQRTDERFDEL